MARATTDPRTAAVVADVGPEAQRLDLAAWLAALDRAAREGGTLASSARGVLTSAGARCVRDGIPLPIAIDAWLTGGWVIWRDLQVESSTQAETGRLAGSLLRALDDGAKAIADGFVREQRSAVRRNETARAALLDDLLGQASVDDVLAAAARVGIDVADDRRVLIVDSTSEAVLDRLLDAGALAAPRGGQTVALLDRDPPRGPERAGLGRPGSGVDGVRRSYLEARRALEVATRLGLVGIVPYHDVMPETLLLRDSSALSVLVESTLAPLAKGGRGAAPLIETLEAYFAEVGNVAATARRLGIGERTAVYRIARIEELTKLDLDDPDDRFRLELAIRGRGLLAP